MRDGIGGLTTHIKIGFWSSKFTLEEHVRLEEKLDDKIMTFVAVFSSNIKEAPT